MKKISKRTGKRIKGKKYNQEIFYYNPYKPRRKKLVERKPDYIDEPLQFYGSGWFTDKYYMIRLLEKPKTRYLLGEKSKEYLESILPNEKENLRKAEICGEFLELGDVNPLVHVRTEDDKHYVYNPDYFDCVFYHYPEAKLFLDQNNKAIFKRGGKGLFTNREEIVGIVQRIVRDEKDLNTLDILDEESKKRYFELTKNNQRS
jgi:hypothetical protein